MARTDDDTWDLASSVGANATLVAASRQPDPLIDDPFAEPLVRAVGVEPITRVLDGRSPLADAALIDVMAVRTRFFDDFLVKAAAAGLRQAVILAAGLDSRAYRLPWPPGTTVYEIDLPEVERCVAITSRQLLLDFPDIKAFVCECHNLPPFSAAIERETGKPVFDILTLVGSTLRAVR